MKSLIAALTLTLIAAAGAASAQSAATPAAAAVASAAQQTAQPHQRTRAEAIAEVIEARKNGTMIETEADMDVAQTKKQIAK
jgi:hypothetical protein